LLADGIDAQIAQEQLFKDLPTTTWSRSCMVTPAITGLYNGEAIRAMLDQQVICCVGDNTHPDLMPPIPYHGWYTTAEKNGYAGLFVMPRYVFIVVFC